MSIVSLLDLTAVLASITALLFIFIGSRSKGWKPEITLFSFIIILTVCHDGGNFLEWSGLTNWFDPVEDYLEILTAALWAFFLYTYLQELTERDLRQSEEKYRRLFETGNDAVLVHTIDEDGGPGVIVDVNDLACARMGYTREQFLEMRPSDIDDPASITDLEHVKDSLQKEGKALFERVHVASDGRKIPVEINAEKFDLFGQTLILSIIRDITARKETEKKLQEILQLDEKILDASPVAFVLRDSDHRVLRVSKAFENVTGFDPGKVVGKRTEEFMPDMPGRLELIARHKRVLDTGLPVGPTEVMAPSPVLRYIRENIYPIMDPAGNVINTLSALEDITTQVAMERKLREVQELDEKILESSPVAFVLHDLDMRVIRVSSAYEKVTGFMAEDVLDRTLVEFIPDGPQRDGIIRRIRNVMDRGVQVGPEDIGSPKPGRYLRETILPVFDPEGRLVNTLTVLEDITEQKQAKDALEESESRYKMLFDNIYDGVVLHNIKDDGSPGRFIEANARFCSMTGYSRAELLNMTPLDLVDEDTLRDTGPVRLDLLEGRSSFFERLITTKTGEQVPCELNAHSIQMAEKKVILSVVRDITERKEAQDRIRNSLAEKETLLREVHHRVKNNLQVISGLLNLQSHYIDDESVKTIYKESQNRIKTMALIHEELYQREDLARINISEYLSGLARNLVTSYSMAKDRVSLSLDLTDAEITIDTAIPCGLLVNEIVSNSLSHAFPEDAPGRIMIRFKPLDGNKFELVISDDGKGLPADLDISRTGTLGLRLVSILAEQLGAELEVAVDGGTAFRLVFEEYMEAGAEMY